MSLLSRSAVDGLDEEDFRRNFDSSTMSFFIEGNDYNFHAMGLELSDIYQSSSKWLNENTGPGKWALEVEDH